MVQILLTLCLITFERASGIPLLSTRPIHPDVNTTIPGVTQNENRASRNSAVESLTVERINFIVYAGEVTSTLDKDPKYEEMKKMLKDPNTKTSDLLKVLEMMSNETWEKLSKLKIKQTEMLEKQKKDPQNQEDKESIPDYMDLSKPDKFTAIDLNLIIKKVATIRPVLEEIVYNKPDS